MSAAFLESSVHDEAQVVASNYFNQFALPDSATRNAGALSKLFGGLFPDPAALQKALFWYNGSVGISWAIPAVVSDAEVAKYRDPFVQSVRSAIPLPQRPARAASDPVGKLSGIPTLFMCGTRDPYLLCSHPYALTTANYITGAPYEYFKADCGHDLIFEGGSGGCSSAAVQKSVLHKLTDFIQS